MIDRPTGRPPALSVGHPPVRTDDGPGAAEDRAGARPQPPGQAPGVRPEDPTGEGAAKLPVAPGVGRGVVLVSVFVCAACGLVYELELVALATYLMGDSVTQASVVLSVMVFAMGIGSLLAKRLRCCAAAGFGYVEALLALVGGGSAMALYADFAWFGEARLVVVGFSLTIGALIGAEMPLLMTLIQRIRAQDAGGAVADLFAADYVGALIGGLAFPFLLLPFLGQLTGALLTGVVNALAGAVVVLWLFRRDLTVRVWWRLVAANAVVVALLLAGAAVVGPFERAARKAVYGGEVRVAKQTDVQEAVLTGDTDPTAYRTGGDPLALFLDGRLRICSADEVRYDESLVHPAMRGGPRGRVLIVGGGDGMALREVLRYEDVRSVTVVEIDGQVPELAREDPGLRRLNGGALEDPRVRLETADAFDWLRERAGRPGAARYDVVVSDLPDPAVSTSTKLYSQEFYGLVSRAMSGEARLAVHAGAPGVRPHDYWTVESTLRAAGLETRPYLVGGRPAGETAVSGGAPRQDGAPRQRSGLRASDWGFVVAAHTGASPDTSAARPYASSGAHGAARPKLRAVSGTELARGRERAVRGRLPGLPPSSLTHPRYRG